jgi:hypothetical protein
LKDAYFKVLEEFICEDRLFDHAFNITMCLFRIYNEHNNYLRREVFLANGIMPKVINLSEDD